MENSVDRSNLQPINKVDFNRKILFCGYGAVARCTLPILMNHIKISPSQIIVIDLEDKKAELASLIQNGLVFIQLKINKENLFPTLAQHLTTGDLLIDLAYEIDTLAFITWCHEHGVLYINASVEEWEPYGKFDTYEETLYYRHMRIREVTAKWIDSRTGDKNGPTAVLDHGANPGLISHFVKKAIVDIAQRSIIDQKFTKDELELVTKILLPQTRDVNPKVRREAFARLAQLLEIKVIHCSELDTQVSTVPRRFGQFVNTWSVEGFHEEGIAPAEMGWGTHEAWIPHNAVLPEEGPKNQIFLQQCGMNTWVRSFVPPNNPIVGMVIRHGEAFTISEYLTVSENSQAKYRPTVHYAYMPCGDAISSLHEVRANNHQLMHDVRIMKDEEIASGSDVLGALVMGHAYQSWWTGSDLDIHQARKLLPGQNCTTIQVAAGMLGAILWIIQNPNQGVCVPDDLPYEFVLQAGMPYLGHFISEAYDWSPLKNRHDLFPRSNRSLETADPWQFSSFLYNP